MSTFKYRTNACECEWGAGVVYTSVAQKGEPIPCTTQLVIFNLLAALRGGSIVDFIIIIMHYEL